MNKVKEIRTITNKICESLLDKLRLEEEMLLMLVKNTQVSLDEKTEAFERIKEINMKQLEVLGQKITILK